MANARNHFQPLSAVFRHACDAAPNQKLDQRVNELFRCINYWDNQSRDRHRCLFITHTIFDLERFIISMELTYHRRHRIETKSN